MERELTRSRPPSTETIQVASVPFGLVPTQAPLISRSKAKLPFFQKAAAVVVVDFARVQDYEERSEGAYARANAPSLPLSKRSVQKGGGAYFRELTVTLNRWQKVEGGMGQGTATELIHLEFFSVFSVQLLISY